MDCAKKCEAGSKPGIRISEKERQEIVKAVEGRWCKCPNGHVYVVTECGSPTQLGKCHECGAVIGGNYNHSLMPGNSIAYEMWTPMDE